MTSTSDGDAGRRLTVASLAHSRARLRELLDPAEQDLDSDPAATAAAGRFPRSRTMRLLAGRNGVRTIAALGAGLLLSRPALGIRLFKIIPIGALARVLLARLLTASGAKS